ncbi:MerR family transcriptional regulator [Alphaproteobacteria bacterium]|nr:MerR family transcriptional regulator [Alphaproteobacteria bacterium]
MQEDDSYFTISKTADIIGVRSHVLRFWEKKFLLINPKKGNSGRRFYSSSDIKFLLYIKKLLYTDGFTIRGAVNFINEQDKKKIISTDNSIDSDIDKTLTFLKEGMILINKNL